MLRNHCKLVFTCMFKPPNYPFQKLSAKKYDKASLLLYSGQCKPAFSKTMTKACWEKVSALHQYLLLYLALCVYFQHHYSWSCGSFYFPILNVDFNYVMDSRSVGLKQCNNQSAIPFVCTPSLYDPNVNILPPTQHMADGGRFCWERKRQESKSELFYMLNEIVSQPQLFN